ncbi:MULTISPECIES: hypothetical protein [unclassified Pseudodesulfovibrio]|uniref:hypothetical protein n=1 Tax=unclassified Pseudodesulfovibrio TaxID=2661612 RepID=UPI000FEB6558|nr:MULTISPECIES: hypothetical protein [unclassified Pseudodesulfovibrio]MCJ2165772.1 hypothetical protein [Pseudodesulfovibrio sp. S3-i]RWU02860.1 hypothetical protein DWB63_13870 [Pseudodesulfovibrio sp. S3]
MAEFIWNGVGLTTPGGWEPAVIERDGLIFACSGRMACELKWNRVQGSFSFEKHIKRLTKGNREAAVRGVPETETPPAWTRAVDVLAGSGLRARSFLWKKDGSRGLGAALHNPGSGMACLVQFFVDDKEDESVAAETLSSLRDYSVGKTVPWAMFGLAGRVPAEFVLDTFSFKPGHYRVVYWRPASGRMSGRVPPGKGPGTRLIFERFAPASVVLKSLPLADWVRQGMEDAPPPQMAVAGDSGRVEWRGAVRTSLLRRALRREVHASGRVWAVQPGNAILSVTAQGTVPAPESVFNAICGSYALVSETAS